MAGNILNENFDKEIAELNLILFSIKEMRTQNKNASLSFTKKLKINIIERDKLNTDAEKRLYDLLAEISDDSKFLNDIFDELKDDKKKNQMIKYLEEEKRTENNVSDVAELIKLDIWGISSMEAAKKYLLSKTCANLFHCLRDIDLSICNDENKVDYTRIFRIMSLLETDEEREMLINTIQKEIESKKVPSKEFMNLIYLKVQNYYFEKQKK